MPGKNKCQSLDSELGLGAATASVSGVGVSAELKLLCCRQRQDFLEALANTLEALATLERVSRLILAALGWLTG